MNLATKVTEDLLAAKLITATTGASLGSYFGFVEPQVIAAAFAGSVTSILYRVIYDKQPDTEKSSPIKATFKLIGMFCIAAVFGVFMGASITQFSPLDRVGATFIGGLLGFGLVGGLLKPDSVKKLTEWFINSLAGRGNKQ
jgi:uncharacterized membrane protein